MNYEYEFDDDPHPPTEEVFVDPYGQKVLDLAQQYGEEVTTKSGSVLQPDGSWREEIAYIETKRKLHDIYGHVYIKFQKGGRSGKWSKMQHTTKVYCKDGRWRAFYAYGGGFVESVDLLQLHPQIRNLKIALQMVASEETAFEEPYRNMVPFWMANLFGESTDAKQALRKAIRLPVAFPARWRANPELAAPILFMARCFRGNKNITYGDFELFVNRMNKDAFISRSSNEFKMDVISSFFRNWKKNELLKLISGEGTGASMLMGELSRHPEIRWTRAQLQELFDLADRDKWSWTELHDALTEVVRRREQEVRQIRPPKGWPQHLEGEKPWEIVFPTHTDELWQWGNAQGHCIGTYGKEAAADQIVLFGLRDPDDGGWHGHGMVRKGYLVQMYGKYNAVLSDHDIIVKELKRLELIDSAPPVRRR